MSWAATYTVIDNIRWQAFTSQFFIHACVRSSDYP